MKWVTIENWHPPLPKAERNTQNPLQLSIIKYLRYPPWLKQIVCCVAEINSVVRIAVAGVVVVHCDCIDGDSDTVTQKVTQKTRNNTYTQRHITQNVRRSIGRSCANSLRGVIRTTFWQSEHCHRRWCSDERHGKTRTAMCFGMDSFWSRGQMLDGRLLKNQLMKI